MSFAMDTEGFVFIKQRIPPAKFVWQTQNSIIDIDNLLIGLEDRDFIQQYSINVDVIKQLIETLN